MVFAQLSGKALNFSCQPFILLLQLPDLLLLLQDDFHSLLQGCDFHIWVAYALQEGENL
jgi:hypothetical protein